MGQGPTARDITAFLLRLHAQSHELGYRAFQHHALQQLADLLCCSAGLVAVGTLPNGVPQGHDVVLLNRPRAFMESWEQIKEEDRVALLAFQSAGRTWSHSVDGPVFDGRDAARAHCGEWDIAQVLCTAECHPTEGLFWVFSLYRGAGSEPFTEEERLAKELIVPHFVAAARVARLGQLRAATRTAPRHGEAGAVATHEGMVVEAEPGFTELLRAQWPAWQGPWLPAEIRALADGAPGPLVRPRIVVRVDTTSDLLLLHVRRPVAADRLTTREREIAEAFSSGDKHREVADRLGISPNTVRRHLSNVYEKLGIASKAELDRMLRGD